MPILGKLKGHLLAALGFLAAALLYVAGQRDRAREAAARAKADKDSAEAARSVERALGVAKDQARKTANDEREKREKRPDDERPTGSFGRLHNDKD